MDYPLFDFVAASLFMGLGIGTDVALATLFRAKQLNSWRLSLVWIVGVSLTHTLFPMAGYLLSYFSIQLLPAITPLIGIVAFACIFHYLKAEFISYAFGEEESTADKQFTLTLGLILAVSWDALWSGPAKSAQVIDWPEFLVWMSFILVGILVSLLALASLALAKHSPYVFFQHNSRLAWFGCWVQYSVISYFGLLALLRYTLGLDVLWWQILLITFALVAALMQGLTMAANVGQRVGR